MATEHYPDHIPSATKVKRLLGIRREISINEDSPLFGLLVDLKRVCSLPQHYLDHIRRFLWREEAIRLVLMFSDQLDIPETLEANLKMVLWYMDTVFNQIVQDAPSRIDDASPDDIQFRSDIFDNYLLIEYWVRRHEPKNITKFRSENDRNLDRSNIYECNWKSYEESIGGVWSGAHYTYALEGRDQTEEIARMLLQHMVIFYDPPIAQDEDFGYPFLHHQDDDDEEGDDKDSEDEDEEEDEDPVVGGYDQ